MQAEHAKLGSEAELIELQLNTIKGQVVFGEDELNRIQGKIADERTRLIETLGAGSSSQTPGKLSNAWIVELLDAEEQFWNTRFRIFSGISLSERKLALDAFKSLRETTGEWGQIAKTLVGDELIEKGGSEGQVSLRNGMSRLYRFQNEIGFAISELEGTALLGLSLLDRLRDVGFAIWDTELYLAEDTACWKGKKLPPTALDLRNRAYLADYLWP